MLVGGSPDDRLEVVGQTVVPVVGMELGHHFHVAGGDGRAARVGPGLFRAIPPSERQHSESFAQEPRSIPCCYSLAYPPTSDRSIRSPCRCGALDAPVRPRSPAATSLVSIGDVFASPNGRRIVPSFAIASAAHCGEEEVLQGKSVARIMNHGQPRPVQSPAHPASAAAVGASRSSP